MTKVCKSCGVEKDEDEYYSFKRARGKCKICFRKMVHEAQLRAQGETEPHAENKGQLWAEMEIEVLLEGADQGMSYKDLAVTLGRTYYAISSKLHSIRLAADRENFRKPAEIRPTRDPNYVASAADEDRWWEPDYYTRGVS